MSALKLFLLSQDVVDGYDTYDSAVVAAGSETEARMLHPSGSREYWDGSRGGWAFNESGYVSNYPDWCAPSELSVKLLGDAAPGIERGVVCASFNAG